MAATGTIQEDLNEAGRVRIRWVSQLMVPGPREWDVPMLRWCYSLMKYKKFSKYDCLTEPLDDHIAWFYEKSSVFSVKSAYHLAMSLDCSNQDQAGCSAREDGTRSVFKCIWSANVPPGCSRGDSCRKGWQHKQTERAEAWNKKRHVK
jgi:hypothetical protein